MRWRPCDQTRRRVPTADEFEAEGLLPGRWDAGDRERLNLLRVIAARGGSFEAMREADRRGDLVTLAAELMFRPAAPCLTPEAVAARADVMVQDVQSVRRACRLPDPGDAAALSEGDVTVVDAFREAAELFGREQSADFLRLVAGSTARIADAAVTMFVTTAGAASLGDDDRLIDVSQRTTRLADRLADVIDVLLRQHLVRFARPNVTGETSPFETRNEAVGFADLSDFTMLASEMSLDGLGRVLLSFERRATEAVTARGGRLIKFVGDGVMFAADDLSAGSRIALDLLDSLVLDRTMPAARAGVAAGSVLVRDGDCFGPVVNAAARAVEAAAPRTVVVAPLDPSCSLDPDLRATPLPDLRLRGVTVPVELRAVEWVHRTTVVPSHVGARR